MPNTSNDSAPVDYVKYFTDQLPHDLARLATLRDELAIRQGSIDAVKQTVELKEQAAKALADAKAEAAAMLAEAKETTAKAKEQKRTLDEREKILDVRVKDFETGMAKRSADADARDFRLAVRESDLTKWQETLTAADAKLKQDREALDARVKAFQAKVAALTA